MNITLRDVTVDDVDALAHVLIAADEQAFRGRVPDHCLRFSEADSAANWCALFAEGLPDGEVMVGAYLPDGELVGYAWGVPDTKMPPYTGELRHLSVLPDYHRHGIGRQLVRHIAARLAEQRIDNLRVEVLHLNPNRAFYERMGAVFVSDYPYDWDGALLTMDVYGWPDTRALRIAPAR